MTGSSGITPAARNATLTSMMVCAALVICLSPNKLALLANSLGYPLDWSGWFYHFTVVLVFTNSCVNPFVYAAKYREFQRAVSRMKSKVRGQNQSQVSTTT